jgi:hypothetical protein
VPDSVHDRLAALRSGYQALELLSSLDDLREQITLRLSAQFAVAADAADARAPRRPGRPGRQGRQASRACVASMCW